MREYPDVFPDEFPGFPPPKEIDFAIELEQALLLYLELLIEWPRLS